MAKRGRKKDKIVCSFDLEEYEFEDLILITKINSPVVYNTYVHKKYRDNLPPNWVLHNKYSK
jgi:hypothetical protein